MLQLDIKILAVFNELDFQKDVAFLQSNILVIAALFNGTENFDFYKSMETLLQHQSVVRPTYQTKTAPNAALEINYKKVKYEEVIGHGGYFFLSIGFGIVWKARYKGELVAIKTIPIQSLTPISIDALNTEVNITRRLANPRIVSCFGTFENEGNQCIV